MNEQLIDQRVQTLWQSQPTEFEPLTVNEIKKGSDRFRLKAYVWLGLEYAFAFFILFGCVDHLLFRYTTPLMRMGDIFYILGLLYIMWRLYRLGLLRPRPATATAATWLDFHRRSLERQRDALRNAWSWYVLPLLPAQIFIFLGMRYELHMGISFGRWIAFLSLWAIACVGLRWLIARPLQRKLDELERSSDRVAK